MLFVGTLDVFARLAREAVVRARALPGLVRVGGSAHGVGAACADPPAQKEAWFARAAMVMLPPGRRGLDQGPVCASAPKVHARRVVFGPLVVVTLGKDPVCRAACPATAPDARPKKRRQRRTTGNEVQGAAAARSPVLKARGSSGIVTFSVCRCPALRGSLAGTARQHRGCSLWHRSVRALCSKRGWRRTWPRHAHSSRDQHANNARPGSPIVTPAAASSSPVIPPSDARQQRDRNVPKSTTAVLSTGPVSRSTDAAR